MTLIASDIERVVVGLGPTGLSCARHLAAQGLRFSVVDSRETPPGLAALRDELPEVPVHTGSFDNPLLDAASELFISPGVALSEPALAHAASRGAALSSDIDLFADAATAPVLAITGSNGKSTVTSLVGDMAARAGLNVGVGGNLGTPALDLLDAQRALYVLELSSFQLERCSRLKPAVAALLNISADHMDRYPDLAAYHRAKQRVFRGATHVVSNRADLLTQPLLASGMTHWSFGLDVPDIRGFGLRIHQGREWLVFEQTPWLAVSELRMVGRHNLENALAALAIGHAAGLPREAMLASLRDFGGLPHRCQFIAEINGVDYYNDSKGTNVGASLAAISGLASDGRKLVLIAGGDGKAADFAPLAASAAQLRAAVLIGRDAERIAAAMPSSLRILRAQGMREAVALAASQSLPGDAVLLSPACASFDMFEDYRHRGDVFAVAVRSMEDPS
ncbi:MAG TPA: UDP-N-acetylmuramoyl-L-alanine--D-glutamate ligase [Spongiibacteraceae bacterium]|nr:UDP-N-acetylmuramoyl-L-alanine--D-glutamate ligase [Spongiibacteraceae bacterium]